MFTFDLETGKCGRADLAGLPKKKRGKKQGAVDFADVYVLDKFLSDTCIYDSIAACGCPNQDTFKALMMFYILTNDPHSWAQTWYEGSYASVLFPDADMDGRRISEFLRQIGDMGIHRAFFSYYLGHIVGDEPTAFIIDSTGVPNSIHMPITGISNHNGEIRMEVRLILVCRKSDRIPLLVRYIPGNVIDSTTLIRTVEEMEAYGINPEYTLIDAGYCTLENMGDLLDFHIGFITRLKPNFDMYKKMVEDHLSDLTPSTRIIHKDRFMRVFSEERVLTDSNRRIWVHLILDEDAKNNEELSAFRKRQEGVIDDDTLDRINATAGIFILVSSMWIDRESVISTYFERGGIEQLIDVGKTNSRLGDAGVHDEETYSGKLLVEFAALSANQMLQNHLKKRKEELSARKRKKKDDIPGRNLSVSHALSILRNQKCDIFDNRLLPRERSKSVNDVYKLFGYPAPSSIDRK